MYIYSDSNEEKEELKITFELVLSICLGVLKMV